MSQNFPNTGNIDPSNKQLKSKNGVMFSTYFGPFFMFLKNTNIKLFKCQRKYIHKTDFFQWLNVK